MDLKRLPEALRNIRVNTVYTAVAERIILPASA
jgi:hypothetical protein